MDSLGRCRLVLSGMTLIGWFEGEKCVGDFTILYCGAILFGCYQRNHTYSKYIISESATEEIRARLLSYRTHSLMYRLSQERDDGKEGWHMGRESLNKLRFSKPSTSQPTFQNTVPTPICSHSNTAVLNKNKLPISQPPLPAYTGCEQKEDSETETTVELKAPPPLPVPTANPVGKDAVVIDDDVVLINCHYTLSRYSGRTPFITPVPSTTPAPSITSPLKLPTPSGRTPSITPVPTPVPTPVSTPVPTPSITPVPSITPPLKVSRREVIVITDDSDDETDDDVPPARPPPPMSIPCTLTTSTGHSRKRLYA